MRTIAPRAAARISRRLVSFAALGMLVATGCARIATQPTAYYRHGPDQAGQPDGYLERGERVWQVGKHRDGRYVRVITDSGIIAYVWEGDLVDAGQWEQPAEEGTVIEW